MNRTAPALLACLLLFLSVVGPALGATTPTVEISNATANEAHFMRAFDAPAMALADFDGDGQPEMVAHNDNQYLYVLSTTQPRVLAEIRPDYPSGWGVRPLNDPAVADVDKDGRLDIVVVNSAAVVCVYEFRSGSSTTSMSFDKQWCRRMDAYDGADAAADAGAWVEDVTGDGRPEIFSQTEKRGLYAFNWDGSVRWAKDASGGNAGPLVADLDGDGRKEALFFGDAGEVRALDAASGSTKWTFWASNHVWPASIPLAGNAADLDGDGRKEVVFTARDAHDANDFKNNHLAIFALDHAGRLKWKAQPSWGNPMSYTHPVLHDLDGDGKKDVLLQDWNTIGHKPGSWQQLGPANVFAYRHDGTLLWRTSLDNSWSNDDLGLADVDGDGRLEVLAIGFGSGGEDGVWYLDARTGAKETHVGVGSGWTILRGPVLGDLGGNDRMGWAISIHDSDRGGAIKVFRTDAPCRETGFLGWQNRFGCGNGAAPPPPPPSGDFAATFRTNGGNEWWVAVEVDANQPLAGVDARVNGGSWKPLEKRWWGEWAASFHAPDGSTVEFRATSTSGAQAVSGGYRWPSGTPTSGTAPPPPPPTGGSFAATFETNGGNEWWVAVKVDANQPLAGVDARVNGGFWRPLEKKWWGEWAGSFHVPDGSTVEFRATSTSGAQVVSGGYRWPSGTPTSGGGAPPPGGSFSATFENARGNNWWVEVDVRASGGTLQAVDARVNGGAWTALSKTSWGSWAKSLHAPEGSTVEFRATSADGQTSTSGSYRWPPA